MVKNEPENIEWVVTGRAEFHGATCIVHAKTREEALVKASQGDVISIETDCAELVNFTATRIEPNN